MGAAKLSPSPVRAKPKTGTRRGGRSTASSRLSEIEAYYASAPIGLCVFDLNLRYLRINDRLAEINGLPAAAHIGRTVHEVVPDLGEQAERIVRRILDTGEPVKDIEFGGETSAQPGVRRLWVEHWYPIKNGRGRVVAINVAVEDVTERRRMEEVLRNSEAELRASQEKLNLLMRSVPAIIWTTDADYRYLRTFGSALDLIGLDSHDVEGRTMMQVLQADDPEHPAIRAARRALAGHSSKLEIEFRGRHLQAHIAPLVDSGGTISGTVGACVDLTERVRQEEWLRQSESRFKSLADNLPSVLMRYDRDLRVIYLSEQAEKVTGIPVQRFIGKTNRDVGMPERLCDAWEKAIREVFRTGENRAVEFEFPAAGGPRTFYLKLAPELGADGHVRSVLGISTDITDRILVEEALRTAHDELERRVRERTRELRNQAELLELAHNAVIVADMESRITFWNRGAEEVYGWTRAEAVGAVIGTLLRTKFPVSREDATATLMREGRWDGELVHTAKDGRVITVLSRQALQRDESGKPAAVMEINLDVTAARLNEERLRQTHKLEAIGTLAGGIAHDFNNILAAILSFNELALLLAEDFQIRSHLKRAIEATLRGRDLVRRILTFSAKSGGERKLVNLVPIVEETVQLLRASLPATIEIRFVNHAGRDTLKADPAGLQQVILNIAANAAQAMPDGGTLSISLTEQPPVAGPAPPDAGRRAEGYLILTVADTGIGMTEAVKSRIFEPFFSTKPIGQNAGMGLAVAYGIVKSHQGDIAVDSSPGCGSVFRVCLSQAQGEIDVVAPVAREVRGGSERILFVDDEENLMKSGGDMLAKFGYVVTTLNCPEEAADLVLKDPRAFDLVITDQTMPGLTGMALAGKLLDVCPDLPIILITGFSEKVSPEKVRKAGIRRFLLKPLTMRQLAEAVRQTLDEAKPGRRAARGERPAGAGDPGRPE